MRRSIIKKEGRRYFTPHLDVDLSKCTKCWKCEIICPEKVFVSTQFLWMKHVTLGNPNDCTGCMKCVRVCPESVFINKIIK